MQMRYCTSLVNRESYEGLPWEFQVRRDLKEWEDKAKRTDESQSKDANHCYYTGFTGKTPSVRVGNENPAERLDALVFDLDSVMSEQTVVVGTKAMPRDYQPRWAEYILSKKWRVVLPLEIPVRWGVENTKHLWDEFLNLVVEQSKIHNIFPGFDRDAFVRTSQIYFNHCNWFDAGEQYVLPGLVIRTLMRDAFDKVSKRHKIASGTLSDFEGAYKELSGKYPKFAQTWTREQFVLGGQGSTFWEEKSNSPMSAIVKREGMYTFSMHADFSFYPWSKLLGPKFVERDHQSRDEFVENTFYFNDAEGKYYKYLDLSDSWLTLNKSDVDQELVSLGIDKRIPKDGSGEVQSEMDKCFLQIRNRNHVSGAGPFMFDDRRKVVLEGDSKCWLNTYTLARPLAPASTLSEWGPNGKFPCLSRILETRFAANSYDLPALLSYLKTIYTGIRERKKQVKQALIMVGAHQTGKTFINQGLISGLVGGFADGGRYLTGATGFSGELFCYPHVAVDDAEMSATMVSYRQYTERVKALVSKADIRTEEKFKTAARGMWYGSIGITANSDMGSLIGALPDLTLSISDKLIILEFAENFMQESEPQLREILRNELPYLARWLLDGYEIPDFMRSTGRYELAPYKNPSVLEEFTQQSDGFLLSQLVVKIFRAWFAGDPEGSKRASYVGDHHDLYNLVTGSGVGLLSNRDWNQKKFIRTLRQVVKDICGCDWIEYNHKTQRWTIFKEKLPNV